MSAGQLRRLVLEAASEGPLSNERVRDITGLDRLDALRLLQELVREGVLVQRGQRRGTRYQLPS
jgi:predicted HTH transcriptional regulator